jgi:hypothetical protein
MITRLHPILLGGLLVGVLDILAAFVVRDAFGGVRPAAVLQGIASGMLGPAAFRGGAATAALGLLLHFLIAFVATAVYYAASRRWRVLVERAVICGLAYGMLVHIVMNQVVLPLSRVPFRPPPWPFVAAMILVHMFCVGLPISLTIRRAERRRVAPAAASART